MIEGIIVCASAMVQTGPHLIAVRFFLGLVQAGVIAGLVFYSSLWYPKREQSFRIAIFFGGGGVYVTGVSTALLVLVSRSNHDTGFFYSRQLVDYW